MVRGACGALPGARPVSGAARCRAGGGLGSDRQQQPVLDLALGPRAPTGQLCAGPSGGTDQRGLAGQIRAGAGVAGNLCRDAALCRNLLSGRQLAARGPNHRALPSGPRGHDARRAQGRLSLPPPRMNPLLQFEKALLVEGQEWTRQQMEVRLQAEVDSWGSLCPRSQQPLEKRKRQRLTLNTCVGKIVIRSWRGYSPAAKKWLHPGRQRWGLEVRQQTSPELEERRG